MTGYSRDETALANFRFNQEHMRQHWRPRLNVELVRVCAQLRARTKRRETQAAIACASIIAELEGAR